MLYKDPEHNEMMLPIVSMCIITDRNRCPPNFTPILKSHDDSTDADLWKDGFGFGIFNRTVRYIAINRVSPENSLHEVITDLAVINEKEAVPTNFVCIDDTADTKERALKKKFICVRFTPRNDALDAVTDVIILNRSKRPPKGYTSAGEVDGALICFSVSTIPQNYGIKKNLPASATHHKPDSSLYPSLGSETAQLSEGLSSNCVIQTVPFVAHKGLDGVPFQLNSKYCTTSADAKTTTIDIGANLIATANILENDYNFCLERSILS